MVTMATHVANSHSNSLKVFCLFGDNIIIHLQISLFFHKTLSIDLLGFMKSKKQVYTENNNISEITTMYVIYCTAYKHCMVCIKTFL